VSSPARVCVIGAGGHAKVVISTLLAAGREIVGVFDDDPHKQGEQVVGVSVVGPIAAAVQATQQDTAGVVIAVGDNTTRKQIAERFRGYGSEAPWVTVVHPSASIDPTVRLGPGTVVFAAAVIQPDTVVGAHGIVNTGATIDHDCVLEDFVHIAPGVHLAGKVRLEEGVFLGVGTSVVPGVNVASWARVGAGAAVVNDLPRGVVAFGVPARQRGER